MELERRLRIGFVLLVVALVGASFGIRVWWGHTGQLDPDELQHLHIAYMIFRGEIPYVDFFAHHTPFLHYLYAGIFVFLGDPAEVVRAARLSMHVFDIALLALVYLLARSLHSGAVAAVAVVLLGSAEYFGTKIIEFRPDGPAAVFWVACVLLLVSGAPRRRHRGLWILASGMSLGVAILFTQKVLFALPAASLGVLLLALGLERSSWSGAVRDSLAFGVGVALPITATCAAFLWVDALGPFLVNNLLVNARWEGPESVTRSLQAFVSWHPLLSSLGVAAFLAQALAAVRGTVRDRRTLLPWLATGILVVGSFVSPSTFRQYYLMLLPFLAIQAAWLAVFLLAPTLSGSTSESVWWAPRRRWLLVVAVASGLALLTWSGMSGPAIWYIGGGTLLGAAWGSASEGRLALGMVCGLLGLVVPSAARVVTAPLLPNEPQFIAMRLIHEKTSPEDPVFDGSSGLGFMRPHAYFYPTLTPGTQSIMSAAERGPMLLEALNATRPRLALLDGNTDRLPLIVQAYFLTDYERLADVYGVRILQRRASANP